jgi:hypothetical protein
MFDKSDKFWRDLSKHLIINRFGFYRVKTSDAANYEKYEGQLDGIHFGFECNKYDNADNYCILMVEDSTQFYYDYLNFEVVLYLTRKLGYVKD